MTGIVERMMAMGLSVIESYAPIDMFASGRQSASVEVSRPCSVVCLQQQLRVACLMRGGSQDLCDGFRIAMFGARLSVHP